MAIVIGILVFVAFMIFCNVMAEWSSRKSCREDRKKAEEYRRTRDERIQRQTEEMLRRRKANA